MISLEKNLKNGARGFIISFLVFSSQFADAASYTFQAAQGKITFLATGRPSAIKIRGEGAGADGVFAETAQGLNGTLKFKLATLTTGIDMRDQHMKEKYLEVGKYPEAQLKITDLKIPASGNIKNQKVTGSLTVKGIEKPVTGTFSTTVSGNEINVDAEFSLKLSDYNIDIPTYMGITVAEAVSVQVLSTVVKSERP